MFSSGDEWNSEYDSDDSADSFIGGLIVEEEDIHVNDKQVEMLDGTLYWVKKSVEEIKTEDKKALTKFENNPHHAKSMAGRLTRRLARFKYIEWAGIYTGNHPNGLTLTRFRRIFKSVEGCPSKELYYQRVLGWSFHPDKRRKEVKADDRRGDNQDGRATKKKLEMRRSAGAQYVRKDVKTWRISNLLWTTGQHSRMERLFNEGWRG